MDKITKAKADLILSQPFFATILLGQKLVETADVQTMATDGETIFVNPAWVEPLTHAEILFVLAHEVLHCVFDHMGRRNDREPEKWNIAADYVINNLLITEKIGVMPKVGLHDPAIVARGGGTAEGVYNCLPKPPPQNGQKPNGKNGKNGNHGDFPKAGEPGGALDQLIDSASDDATRSQKSAEMRVKIIQAKNAAKMAGKISAGLERLIDDMTRPKVDWRRVLRNFLTERSRSHYSFAKPKRRFLAEDLIFPSLVGEQLGHIVIGVDCSGSVDNAQLEAFGAEINGILEDTGANEAVIIYFDAEVLRVTAHNREEMGPVKLEAIGGGGTAFSPIWEAIAKLDNPPVAAVILTDLYCDDFGSAPDYPVLWTSVGKTDAPFGEIVPMED